MKITIDQLKELVNSALKKYGYSEEEIPVIADILLYAQLRGNNQGVVKLIGKGIPRRAEGRAPVTVKETAVSALIDGNKSHAMIVMNLITETAVRKAKEAGVGMAGSFNTAESTGALGYYVNKIAKEGLIGMAFSSAPFQTTAPHGANEARFCTNPVAFGIPTETDSIVLDMTTSAMAYYGLIEAKTAGREVAAGTGYDKDGRETTDPAAIMGGALKTMGGHRGSGLALIVQILAGAWVKADSFDNSSDNAGNLVMAVDPNLMVPEGEFKSRVNEIVGKVKSARKIEGVSEVLFPGERGNKLRQEREEAGEIEVEDNLLAELKRVSG